MPRIFGHPGIQRRVVIGDAALQVFHERRQLIFRAESGGLLFATYDASAVHIVEATVPTPKDRRGDDHFILDLESAQLTINERFQHGLHYVGEWHTHGVLKPVPSARDLQTVKSAYEKSKHSLEALIMIIVGRQITGRGLWVGLHNKSGNLRLCETEAALIR